MFGVTLLLIASTLWKSQAALEKHTFKTWKGYKLLDGTRIKDISLINMSFARCASYCTGDCESVTFSRTLNQCVTFKDRVYDSSIKRIRDPQWYIIYKNKPVQFGNWTLVFRAQRDTNQSLYKLWNSSGTSDDNPLSVDFPFECLQLTYSNTCRRHFRSFILDQWVNIDMVKFSLYKNGIEEHYILFDGRSSTTNSWYNKSKIINSSWWNIQHDVTIAGFDIEGLDTPESKRRFSINGPYLGCHFDVFYFFAIDGFTDACSPAWALAITSFPKLIYSPSGLMVPMFSLPPGKTNDRLRQRADTYAHPAYHYADVMSVFVTFKM